MLRRASNRPSAYLARLSWGLLLLAVATLAPPVAHAGAGAGVRESHRVGGIKNRWIGADRCRGAKIQADRDAVLLGFDMLLRQTSGVRLDFHVYESKSENGTFARLGRASSKKFGSIGKEFDWESSPPLYAQMRPGRYYVVLACWGRGALVGYRGQPAVAPQKLGVGNYVGGASYTVSAKPPAELALATDTHDYFARVHVSAGEALTADTRRSYSGPFEPGRFGKARGNIYAVNRDAWLTGFDQLFNVSPEVLDSTVQWHVYRCARRAACVNGAPSWSVVASGEVPVVGGPINHDRWLGTESLRIRMHAGQTYWIGFSWRDARIRSYRFTAPEVAPSWGHYLGNGYATPLPLTSRQSFRAVFNSALPQHLLTVPARRAIQTGDKDRFAAQADDPAESGDGATSAVSTHHNR
ncbi:MAG: hypothetical protein V3R77_00895 [Candidatus Binatia bacterium]